MSTTHIFFVEEGQTASQAIEKKFKEIKQFYFEERLSILPAEGNAEDYNRITSYPRSPETFTAFYIDADPSQLLCVITAPKSEKEGELSVTVYNDEEATDFLSKRR